jgi:hypothetical protein
LIAAGEPSGAKIMQNAAEENQLIAVADVMLQPQVFLANARQFLGD